jgi:uncharacterized small protein (DUF1192 family)
VFFPAVDIDLYRNNFIVEKGSIRMLRNQVDYTPTQNLYYGIFKELPARDVGPEDLPELIEVLNTLATREVRIIRMRYSIGENMVRRGVGCKLKSYNEIGATFQVTGDCIKRIHDKALRKLAHPGRATRLRLIFATSVYLRAEIRERDTRIAAQDEELDALKAQLAEARFSRSNASADNCSGLGDEERSETLTVAEMDLSVRSMHYLKYVGIDYVYELISCCADEIAGIKNLGQKSLEEIQWQLRSLGLSLSDRKPRSFDRWQGFKFWDYKMDKTKEE